MAVHKLSKREARRIAIRAQLLSADRPTDLVEMVEHLTLLQIDPTAAIAPAVDLVSWSRLGSRYRPERMQQALEEDRDLFEHGGLIRPMSDVGLHLAEAKAWPRYETWKVWLRQNESFRLDILELLRADGPLTSREIPDTSNVPWQSSGWTNNQNVSRMLESLTMSGEVAISGRQGRERVWDLAERVYPLDVEIPSLDEAVKIKNGRRLKALGIARAKSTHVPVDAVDVDQSGEPAIVDGVDGEWRVDPDQLDRPFEGRTALVSPYDRLVYDRLRTAELFDFEYIVEMYKPAAKRRWGYFALPILHQDQLVGKLDAKADRKAGVLEVHAVHPDVRFTRSIRAAVDAEIDALAAWLGLTVVRP
jgi:uncharacterized protein YcaQ